MKTGKPLAILAAGMSSLALCAGAASAGEVTWWSPNFNIERAEELKAKFEADNPGITINLESTTTNGLPQRILTTLRSGSAPDIIDAQHPWVTGYAQNELVIPLGDVIEDRDDYHKAALDYVTYDGELYGIPYRIEALAVLCNRGHFEEAGLDPENPPETWAEFVDAAEKLTKEGRSGFAITNTSSLHCTVLLVSALNSLGTPRHWPRMHSTPPSVEPVK